MEEPRITLSKTQETKRRRRKYPNVFFKKEITAVFDNLDNPRTIMGCFIAFFCALRISEVVNLQWKDIDIEEKRLKVVNGKNHKDGFIPISSIAIPILKKWKTINQKEEYVIPRIRNNTTKYGSVTNILPEQYCCMKQRKARIKQKLWKQQNTTILRCFCCKTLLKNNDEDYIFCQKCYKDLESSGKNPKKLTKKYKLAIKKDKNNL